MLTEKFFESRFNAELTFSTNIRLLNVLASKSIENLWENNSFICIFCLGFFTWFLKQQWRHYEQTFQSSIAQRSLIVRFDCNQPSCFFHKFFPRHTTRNFQYIFSSFRHFFIHRRYYLLMRQKRCCFLHMKLVVAARFLSFVLCTLFHASSFRQLIDIPYRIYCILGDIYPSLYLSRFSFDGGGIVFLEFCWFREQFLHHFFHLKNNGNMKD